MSYKAYMDSNHIVAWDAGGADKTVCTIVERRGSQLHIVDMIERMEFVNSYLEPDMLIRFKLIELRMLEKARQVKAGVIAEIKKRFECLVDGHDFFSVHDSQGDGMFWQNFSYLECRNCGEQHPYDGRDDYMDSEDDWDRTPL